MHSEIRVRAILKDTNYRLVGVQVQLNELSTGLSARTHVATTNMEGEAVFGMLPAGDYRITTSGFHLGTDTRDVSLMPDAGLFTTVLLDLVLPCNRPPEGWECTRGQHDGPCAAVPKEKSKDEIITGLEEALARAINDQVYGFFLDGPPTFVQGDKAGEVCDLITADDLNKWFPPRELKCKYSPHCDKSGLGPHTTAQHAIAVNERVIKELPLGIEFFNAINDAVNRDAMVNGGDGVVLSRDEALILQKLLRGYVVGPDARKVLDKINAVQG